MRGAGRVEIGMREGAGLAAILRPPFGAGEPRIPPGSAFEVRRYDGFTVVADVVSEAGAAFAHSVAHGLSDQPRWLHCRYLYDERGSEIFERITDQPEYYLTRAETEILERHAREVRNLAGEVTLVELGSGVSAKTRHLLSAWTAEGPARYVPVDIDGTVLTAACASLVTTFPSLSVTGLATSYERALPLVARRFPMLLVFLGSTVGNFNALELEQFLQRISAALAPGDGFLLGIDLVKDPAELEAAYNDAAGWSAAFTRNLFARMNNELGTGLPLDAIRHVAYYNDRLERIEIYARFEREAIVDLPAIGRWFRLAAGEMVLTEISGKFRVETMRVGVARHGFDLERTWTDAGGRFGLLLFRKRRDDVSTEDRRATLAARLRHVRRRTLDLLEPMADDVLTRQHDPLMSPLVWDLGHIAKFEELWLVRGGPAADESGEGDVVGEAGEASLEAGELAGAAATKDSVPGEGLGIYDAVANPRTLRGRLALPGRGEVLRELLLVRERALERLAEDSLDPSDPLHADGFVYNLVAQHEAQHQETMLQALGIVPELRYEPVFRESPGPARYAPDTDLVIVPAGPFPMGTEPTAFAYDNEQPLHWVDVPAFGIDVAPVHNEAYLAFVEDGGYRRPELWSREGWAWREKEAVEHPGGWRRDGAGGWVERRFGRVRPLARNRPVVHVCWHEATAFARWIGKRLPTEVEWEKAAAWDVAAHAKRAYPWGDQPPTAVHANLDQRLFGPAEVGAYPAGRSFYGCHQMLGDVWEWTASDFLPYPGFLAFPYRGYSEIFFGSEYKVLRGGSWATSSIVARNTFRNWDYPVRRQIFAGFRCAVDL